MSTCRVISCSNMKGGTGKTTTVNSLAAHCARKGFRVAVIDLDPQSNLTIGFGVDPQDLKGSMYDVLAPQSIPIEQVMVEKEGLFLAPAHMDMVRLEMQLVSLYGRETILNKKLLAIKDNYDLIIIDCPPSLNIFTINALCASDYVIIPIQCSSYYALYGIAQLLESINWVQQELNPNLEVLGVALTMENRTRISGQIIEEVNRQFEKLVFKTVIRQNVKLSEAPAMGTSIFGYAASSQGADDYARLAEEVVKRAGL
ncbi:MAG: chromosome segregation ATPase [Chloroflexi bacterium]|jgi:chromosome partitioning protein|nr:chromosome segregation ATPase [Chloroflexota bacterium]